jgi:UPF0271 protein
VQQIDLNADVGESFGAYAIGNDAALMPSITSANIAAGFHAGDPSVLRATVRLAKAHGVAIGAHPGFPDRAGFGRRDMKVAAGEAEDFILYQIAAVAGIAAAEGARLRHVKAHGALFNMAATDRQLADALARAVAAFDRSLVVFAPATSEMAHAARALGLTVAREAFADRAYEADGRLAPRQSPTPSFTTSTRSSRAPSASDASGSLSPLTARGFTSMRTRSAFTATRPAPSDWRPPSVAALKRRAWPSRRLGRDGRHSRFRSRVRTFRMVAPGGSTGA